MWLKYKHITINAKDISSWIVMEETVSHIIINVKGIEYYLFPDNSTTILDIKKDLEYATTRDISGNVDYLYKLKYFNR